MKHETNMSMGSLGLLLGVCILGPDRPGMSFGYSAILMIVPLLMLDQAGCNELSWSQPIVALAEASRQWVCYFVLIYSLFLILFLTAV